MKKIALIMDGWKRWFTFAWPAGILQRIRQTGEEVSLYIFNSSGGWSCDEEYNTGEYNIYRLPDLREFDGIILDLNNIGYPEVWEDVIRRAKESGVPVISIANEIEDFYYVGINNEKAMRMMIEHLYEKHGCKKYWFVMGPEDNYENVKRIAALRAYMDEKQLTYSESDFIVRALNISAESTDLKNCLKHTIKAGCHRRLSVEMIILQLACARQPRRTDTRCRKIFV